MALFSFNDPPGKSNVAWHGFTLDAWLNPFGVPGLFDVVRTSVVIAFLSTHRRDGPRDADRAGARPLQLPRLGATNTLIFLPMATPEIVLGASLLTLFVAIGAPPFFPTNFVTILIAHIMFNISFVVVTVRARLYGFDRHLEEAAMDLGANEWTTFWKVTFPLILPGILAAGLLAFSLSIDDYVITSFTAGRTLDVPDLHLGLGPRRRAGPGQRHRHGVLRDRRRVRRDHRRSLKRGPTGHRGRSSRPSGSPPPPRPSPPARSSLHPGGRSMVETVDSSSPATETAPLPDRSVVPRGLGPDHEPDRRPRRGLVAGHHATASATSTTRPGIGVTNTGHAHPRVVAAIQAQAAKLLHGQQNIVYHEPGLRLYERLPGLLPGGPWQAFLSNSGRRGGRGVGQAGAGRRPAGRRSSRSATASTAGPARRWP